MLWCIFVINGISDFYSKFQFSQSISEARKRGVLVAVPNVITADVEAQGTRYKIKEVWIEEVIQRYRKWLFLPEKRELYYKIVATVIDPAKSLRSESPESCRFTVNGDVVLGERYAFEGLEVLMGKINLPFPVDAKLDTVCSK